MNQYQATVKTIYENKVKWAMALGEEISEKKNDEFLGDAIAEALKVQEVAKELINGKSV